MKSAGFAVLNAKRKPRAHQPRLPHVRSEGAPSRVPGHEQAITATQTTFDGVEEVGRASLTTYIFPAITETGVGIRH